MVFIEQKKFSEEESKLFYNFENRIFMDDNGNILINNDSNNEILRYENTLTNKPITNDIYKGYIQNINNTTDTTYTFGLINNNPEDNNPCISTNGTWILHRNRLVKNDNNKDKEYKPIYSLSYSTDQLPLLVNGPNYLLLISLFFGGILACLLSFVFLFYNLKKNNKNDLKI